MMLCLWREDFDRSHGSGLWSKHKLRIAIAFYFLPQLEYYTVYNSVLICFRNSYLLQPDLEVKQSHLWWDDDGGPEVESWPEGYDGPEGDDGPRFLPGVNVSYESTSNWSESNIENVNAKSILASSGAKINNFLVFKFWVFTF